MILIWVSTHVSCGQNSNLVHQIITHKHCTQYGDSSISSVITIAIDNELCYIWNTCVAYILSLVFVWDSNFCSLSEHQLVQWLQTLQFYNTVKESTCTPELVQLVNGM